MCGSQQGKATDARAPSAIDRVSMATTQHGQNQRLTWTRIALTHTHTLLLASSYYLDQVAAGRSIHLLRDQSNYGAD